MSGCLRAATASRAARPRAGALNRPDVRNVIDRSLARATDAALTRLETDPRVAVGILAGAGGRFCSGMDLKAFPTDGVPVVAGRGSPG
ncbi:MULTISPECIES: enoyl-CoA hydratase-related protein [unclassified Streptomyces]|uniref:enoyl-CoA hydratase-related protein n=1 Tax=unclassified Streptomyces TaxID=2593676 RepID=UPI002E80952E|nr:enoyl-CoA hydratase-related protein [Streptomyces sp. NBC_00589]WTI42308.1 enoyl-CoA hydratase-related protein [Streptomyces sp. NBC_00775]WUB24010.1 enoyl-CoA hydratase-related protein [Streptomyces sp. NBC_00589]